MPAVAGLQPVGRPRVHDVSVLAGQWPRQHGVPVVAGYLLDRDAWSQPRLVPAVAVERVSVVPVVAGCLLS